jgi:hypothetical protein
MTKSDFAKLAKRLLPSLLPGFEASGNLCLVSPFSGTVRGFHFEPSAFSKTAFYVNTFFFPLCVPAKQFHFTFGHRLGGNGRWDSMDPMLLPNLSKELQKERPFLLGLSKPIDVSKALKPLAELRNPHSLEAFAYTLILAGQVKAAADTLNDLLSAIDKAIIWQQEIASRAILIRDKLRSQPESASEQLATWERETARDLGIAKFLARSTNLSVG